MPWIKVDVDFPDHPKIKPIAEALGIEKDHAAGILTRWFCWLRKYAQDGCLEGKEFEAPGFSPEKNRILTEALTTAGFIKSGWVNDWPEYGGAEIAEKAKREPSKFKKMLDFYGLNPYGKKPEKKREKYGLEEKRKEEIRKELKPKDAAKAAHPDYQACKDEFHQTLTTAGKSPEYEPRDFKALKGFLAGGKSLVEFRARLPNLTKNSFAAKLGFPLWHYCQNFREYSDDAIAAGTKNFARSNGPKPGFTGAASIAHEDPLAPSRPESPG